MAGMPLSTCARHCLPKLSLVCLRETFDSTRCKPPPLETDLTDTWGLARTRGHGELHFAQRRGYRDASVASKCCERLAGCRHDSKVSIHVMLELDAILFLSGNARKSGFLRF